MVDAKSYGSIPSSSFDPICKEVAQAAEKDKEIIAQAQVLESLPGPPINVQEVGGSFMPTSIDNPLRPSYFYLGHLLGFSCPSSDSFLCPTIPNQSFTLSPTMENPPIQLTTDNRQFFSKHASAHDQNKVILCQNPGRQERYIFEVQHIMAPVLVLPSRRPSWYRCAIGLTHDFDNLHK